jgi:hypothetical protein
MIEQVASKKCFRCPSDKDLLHWHVLGDVCKECFQKIKVCFLPVRSKNGRLDEETIEQAYPRIQEVFRTHGLVEDQDFKLMEAISESFDESEVEIKVFLFTEKFKERQFKIAKGLRRFKDGDLEFLGVYDA